MTSFFNFGIYSAKNSKKSFVMITGSAVGTFMCLKNVLDGHFTVGDYIMFGTYIMQLYTPLNYLGTYYRMIQGAFIDTENLMDLLAEYPERKEPAVPVKLENRQGYPYSRIRAAFLLK